jgi:hypothetical protein
MLRFSEDRKITLPVLYSASLEGPKEITIPKGEKLVEFMVSVKDDKLVNLRRRAWIELMLGPETSAKLKTLIHDDERAPKLTIDGPSEIIEKGGKYRTARILLDRPADLDFPIRVEWEPKGRLIARTIIVRTGKTSVPVVFSVPGDEKLTGDIPISMVVRGRGIASDLVPARKRMTLIDQAKFELGLMLPAFPLVEGQSELGLVSIQGRHDKPVKVVLHSNHPELIDLDETVTIPAGYSGINFTMMAKDTSVLAVDQKVTVTARATGFSDGVATMTHRETREIGHVRTMDMSADDLVWDPIRKRIYASVPYYPFVDPGYWPFESSGIVEIDPETLEVTRSVKLLLARQLVLSKDGQSLYAASGTRTIRRISLPDFSIRESYSAGNSADGSGREIRDFWPLENHPGKIAMALDWNSGKIRQAGFEVRDEAGAVSPAVIADEYTSGPCLIEPSGDPDVLCGITDKVGRKLRVDENGMLTETAAVQLSYYFWSGIDPSSPNSWFRFDGDGAYCSGHGVVLDANSLQPIRDYDRHYSDVVCPETQGNRDYFLSGQGIPEILAYDRASSSLVGKTAFSQDELKYGTHLNKSLIRWGSDGLAFSTDSKLILVNNQRIAPSDPAADLEVKLESNKDLVRKGIPVRLTVRVTNKGAHNATGAVLNLRCAMGGLLVPVSSSGGTPVYGQQSFSAQLPVITAGATWTTNLELTISADSPVKCVAGITADAFDPDFTNNSAEKTVSVVFDPAERLQALAIGAVDCAADPDGKRVWLAVPLDLDRQFSNMVVAVDPKTGLFLRSLPIPWVPAVGTLSVTGNGRYLLVGSATGNEVCRFDLNAEDSVPERFSLDSMRTLLAVHPVDENGDTLVVTGTTHVPYLDGKTAVYDGGVMRSKVVNHWFDFDTVVTRPSDNRVYVFDAFVYTYSIDAEGLVLAHRSDVTVSGSRYVVNGKVSCSELGLVNDLETGALLHIAGSGTDEGVPLFDVGSGRLILSFNTMVSVWNPDSWASYASLPIKITNLSKTIRWGPDGLAMRAGSTVYFLTWPEGLAVGPAATSSVATVNTGAVDSDGDGTPDVMETIFGTSAFHPNANPLKIGMISANGQKTMRLEFTRRADMTPPTYSYELSDDCRLWTRSDQVNEVVISRFTREGVEMEGIEAIIPLTGSSSRFVRLSFP